MSRSNCTNCLFLGSESCDLYPKNTGCCLKHDLLDIPNSQKKEMISKRMDIEVLFKNLVNETKDLDHNNCYDLMDFEDYVQRLKGVVKIKTGIDIHIHGGLRYGAIFFTVPKFYNKPIFREDGMLISTIK